MSIGRQRQAGSVSHPAAIVGRQAGRQAWWWEFQPPTARRAGSSTEKGRKPAHLVAVAGRQAVGRQEPGSGPAPGGNSPGKACVCGRTSRQVPAVRASSRERRKEKETMVGGGGEGEEQKVRVHTAAVQWESSVI